MPASPRICIDVSSLVRWTGPATGMIRVESELAACARRQLPDAIWCFYDIGTNTFRSVSKAWADKLVSSSARLAPQSPARAGWVRYMPDRTRVLMALERLRLTAGRRELAWALDRLQRLLLSLRSHRFPIDDEAGERLALVPFDMAIGEPLTLGQGDVVLSASSDWWTRDAAAIACLKRQAKFRLVVLCYDIIPLLFPQFFPEADVARFRTYWEEMFRSADLVIVNARRTKIDIENYCAGRALQPAELAVVPLGCDLPTGNGGDGGRLRPGLERDRYALFVSTIEPRKNHRLLLSVWRDLIANHVVEDGGFKLVFVGRRGWMNDEVQSQLDGGALGGSVMHIEHVDDRELAVLYANAAFCLYPSRYEGFGLPVVEAVAHGKAVIVSNGGALAELATDVAPCLSPDDAQGWYRQIADWIQFPEHRKAAAQRIAGGLKLHTWSEVAAEMIALARGTG
jgi:glycosyltransferase involved in cell wall biosynthesis